MKRGWEGYEEGWGGVRRFLKARTLNLTLPIPRTQTLVMNAIVEHLSEPTGSQDFFTLSGRDPDSKQREVASLVELMACCCIGMNSSTERLAQRLLPPELCLSLLAEPDHPVKLVTPLYP